MDENAYWFNYTIELEDGQKSHFHIELDPLTLTMMPASPEPYPPWTQLAYKQCKCCPLVSQNAPILPHCREYH
jgi:hypothetical protein